MIKQLILTGLLAASCQAHYVPGKHWQKYDDPEHAGYSVEKLAVLRKNFLELDGEVLMVIHQGRVLLIEGAIDRRFRQTSVRKSYVSALVGIYEDRGHLDLHGTLQSLGISDDGKLTPKEASARLIDLLRTSSGIYLPSAYSLAELPERGSKELGYWQYNNWDFNVVGAIFNQEVPLDLFEAFQKHLAQPLMMEDFRMIDTHYRYEKDKSAYPAYLFRLSARDMARFGLLYLNKGKWGSEQLVPAAWVQESTRAHTTELTPGFTQRGGYGLMWWVMNDFEGEPLYFASGAGGQRIMVFPESELVMVHVTDNYQRRNVSENQIQKMATLLLAAKEGSPHNNPKLSTLKLPTVEQKPFSVNKNRLLKYAGVYQHPALGPFEVLITDEVMLVKTGIGHFNFHATSDSTFYNRDIGQTIMFKETDPMKKGKIVPEVDASGTVKELMFYY